MSANDLDYSMWLGIAGFQVCAFLNGNMCIMSIEQILRPLIFAHCSLADQLSEAWYFAVSSIVLLSYCLRMAQLMDLSTEIHLRIVAHFMQDLKITELSLMHSLSDISSYWKVLVRQNLDDGLRRLTRHVCICATCKTIRQKRKRSCAEKLQTCVSDSLWHKRPRLATSI